MKIIKRILPFVGIIILAYIILRIGPENIINTFLGVNPLYLVPATLLVLVYISIQNIKWKYLLKQQGISVGFVPLFKITVIGIFYGLITPGKVGNLIRIKYLKKRTGKSTGECCVSVIFDKMMDLLVLFVFSLVGIIMLAKFISFELAVIVSLFSFIFFIAVTALLREDISRRILRIFWKHLVPEKMKMKTKETFDTFFDNKISIRNAFIPFLLTVVAWIVLYSSAYLIAISIGIDIYYPVFLTIMPIATIIGLIPITVSGWGTREATLIVLFSIFGISSDKVLVMSLISNTLTYLLISVLGASASLSEEKLEVR
jgi:uncharacterized protein (TIRG00374 family)